MFALVVFGFIAFGMIFTGMMCVLPAAVGPHASATDASGPGMLRSFIRSISTRTQGVFHRWFNPAGVEIRRPRFH
jgi:hypothetical protein